MIRWCDLAAMTHLAAPQRINNVDPAQQIAVRREDRVRIVKMPSSDGRRKRRRRRRDPRCAELVFASLVSHLSLSAAEGR